MATPPLWVEILAEVVKPEWPWGDTLLVSGSMERALIIAGSRAIVGFPSVLEKSRM